MQYLLSFTNIVNPIKIGILLLGILSIFPLSAQQWESFPSPADALSNDRLRTIQDKIFVSNGSGLYRSKDGGDHWEQIRNYQSIDGFQAFEVNRNNNRLYYSQGLDSMNFWSLYTSADLGDTWSLIGNVRASVSAFIGDTIYGACFGPAVGGLCSKWNSQNWKDVTHFPKDTAGIILSVAATGQHLWVATPKGVYHSPDAGTTWQLSLHLTGPNGLNLRLQALNGTVVAINEPNKRLYFSKDLGQSWQDIPWLATGLYNTGQHLFATLAGGTQLLRSQGTDVANWETIPIGAYKDIKLTGAGEYNDTYWLGSEELGVIRKRPDAAIWAPYNGLPVVGGANPFYKDGRMFLNQIIQTFSDDNGATWQQNVNRLNPAGMWQNGNYNYLLGSAGNYTPIIRSLRNGRFEWAIHATPPDLVKQVAVSGDTLLAVRFYTPSQLYRSLDNGGSWTTVDFPYEIQPYTPAPIRSQKGKFYCLKGPSVYRSDDAGLSWQATHTFPYTIDETVSLFLMLHDTLLIAYPPLKLTFYSTDGGENFDTLSTPENATSSTYRIRSDGQVILLYLGQELLYFSKDVGQTWVSFQPPPGVSALAVVDAWAFGKNTLFAAGNWRLRFDQQRQIVGQVFLDINSNGQKDPGEKGLNNLLIKAAQSNVLGATYNDGNFSMLLGQNADALSVATIPLHYKAVPASIPVPAGPVSMAPVSFVLQPQGTVNDAVVTLVASSAFRAGYVNTVYVQVKNAGTISNSGQIKLVLPPILTYTSAMPAADLQSGDTLIWNYNNLLPLQNRSYQVFIKTAVVPPGTTVFLRATSTNMADVNLNDNVAVLESEIISSYDPNDKTVSAPYIPVDQVNNEELTYTVRFQNLGNTTTDFITIRDTLSESLDVSSIRVLTSSHPYDWQIEDGRVLVFRFNPIQLSPASTDSLRSQGFVQFAAKLRTGLQVGDEIANTAHIYFDFNPAIVTNTVHTAIQVVSTFEPARLAQVLDIFPNPAGSEVTLRLPGGIHSAGRIEIFSAAGKLMYSASASDSNVQTIQLPPLPTGAYWCRWVTTGGTYWGKLAIQR